LRKDQAQQQALKGSQERHRKPYAKKWADQQRENLNLFGRNAFQVRKTT